MCLFTSLVNAKVKIESIAADHMVLQRWVNQGIMFVSLAFGGSFYTLLLISFIPGLIGNQGKIDSGTYQRQVSSLTNLLARGKFLMLAIEISLESLLGTFGGN